LISRLASHNPGSIGSQDVIARVKSMAKQPVWVPAPYHLEGMPSLAKYINSMPEGRDNPMGARAKYLFQGKVDTINRIHGGAKPSQIEDKTTVGCIGMLNIDVIHRYDSVEIGTRIVMLS